jgi:hypothetical protein
MSETTQFESINNNESNVSVDSQVISSVINETLSSNSTPSGTTTATDNSEAIVTETPYTPTFDEVKHQSGSDEEIDFAIVESIEFNKKRGTIINKIEDRLSQASQAIHSRIAKFMVPHVKTKAVETNSSFDNVKGFFRSPKYFNKLLTSEKIHEAKHVSVSSIPKHYTGYQLSNALEHFKITDKDIKSFVGDAITYSVEDGVTIYNSSYGVSKTNAFSSYCNLIDLFFFQTQYYHQFPFFFRTRDLSIDKLWSDKIELLNIENKTFSRKLKTRIQELGLPLFYEVLVNNTETQASATSTLDEFYDSFDLFTALPRRFTTIPQRFVIDFDLYVYYKVAQDWSAGAIHVVIDNQSHIFIPRYDFSRLWKVVDKSYMKSRPYIVYFKNVEESLLVIPKPNKAIKKIIEDNTPPIIQAQIHANVNSNTGEVSNQLVEELNSVNEPHDDVNESVSADEYGYESSSEEEEETYEAAISDDNLKTLKTIFRTLGAYDLHHASSDEANDLIPSVSNIIDNNYIVGTVPNTFDGSFFNVAVGNYYLSPSFMEKKLHFKKKNCGFVLKVSLPLKKKQNATVKTCCEIIILNKDCNLTLYNILYVEPSKVNNFYFFDNHMNPAFRCNSKNVSSLSDNINVFSLKLHKDRYLVLPMQKNFNYAPSVLIPSQYEDIFAFYNSKHGNMDRIMYRKKTPFCYALLIPSNIYITKVGGCTTSFQTWNFGTLDLSSLTHPSITEHQLIHNNILFIQNHEVYGNPITSLAVDGVYSYDIRDPSCVGLSKTIYSSSLFVEQFNFAKYLIGNFFLLMSCLHYKSLFTRITNLYSGVSDGVRKISTTYQVYKNYKKLRANNYFMAIFYASFALLIVLTVILVTKLIKNKKTNKIKQSISKTKTYLATLTVVTTLTGAFFYFFFGRDVSMKVDRLVQVINASPNGIIAISAWLKGEQAPSEEEIHDFVSKAPSQHVSIVGMKNLTNGGILELTQIHQLKINRLINHFTLLTDTEQEKLKDNTDLENPNIIRYYTLYNSVKNEKLEKDTKKKAGLNEYDNLNDDRIVQSINLSKVKETFSSVWNNTSGGVVAGGIAVLLALSYLMFFIYSRVEKDSYKEQVSEFKKKNTFKYATLSTPQESYGNNGKEFTHYEIPDEEDYYEPDYVDEEDNKNKYVAKTKDDFIDYESKASRRRRDPDDFEGAAKAYSSHWNANSNKIIQDSNDSVMSYDHNTGKSSVIDSYYASINKYASDPKSWANEDQSRIPSDLFKQLIVANDEAKTLNKRQTFAARVHSCKNCGKLHGNYVKCEEAKKFYENQAIGRSTFTMAQVLSRSFTIYPLINNKINEDIHYHGIREHDKFYVNEHDKLEDGIYTFKGCGITFNQKCHWINSSDQLSHSVVSWPIKMKSAVACNSQLVTGVNLAYLVKIKDGNLLEMPYLTSADNDNHTHFAPTKKGDCGSFIIDYKTGTILGIHEYGSLDPSNLSPNGYIPVPYCVAEQGAFARFESTIKPITNVDPKNSLMGEKITTVKSSSKGSL